MPYHDKEDKKTEKCSCPKGEECNCGYKAKKEKDTAYKGGFFTDILKGGQERGGKYKSKKRVVRSGKWKWEYKYDEPKKKGRGSALKRLLEALVSAKSVPMDSMVSAVNHMTLGELLKLRGALKKLVKQKPPKEEKATTEGGEEKEPKEPKEPKEKEEGGEEKEKRMSMAALLKMVEARIGQLQSEEKESGKGGEAKAEAEKTDEKKESGKGGEKTLTQVAEEAGAKKNPDAALLAGHHSGDPDATKKMQARAEELLPGIRMQDAVDVVAVASENNGKLPKEFVDRMIRENRVAGKKPEADEKPKAVSSKPDNFPLGDAEWELLSKLREVPAHSAEAKKLLKENEKAASNLKFNTMLSLFTGMINNEVVDKFFEAAPKAEEKPKAEVTARYQAYLDATEAAGKKPSNIDFMAWTNKKWSEYEAEVGPLPKTKTKKLQDEFDKWLASGPKTEEKPKAEAGGPAPNIATDKKRKVPSLDGATYHDTLDVDDYPYGRSRTQARFSVEKMKNGNERGVMQTKNPKTGSWNKPKKTTSGKKVKIVQVDGKTYIATSHGDSIHLQHAAGFKSAGYVYGEAGAEEGTRRFVANAKASDPGHHELHVGIYGKSEAQRYAEMGISRAGDPSPSSTTGKPRTDKAKEKEAPAKEESTGMLSNKERLEDIHDEGYLVTPALKPGKQGGSRNEEENAKRHAKYEKQHKEMVEAGHLEDLGHGVYADAGPPKAKKGKKGTVTVKNTHGGEGTEVPATIYGKGDWAITKDPKDKGKVRVTHVAAGLGIGGAMTGPQATYMMDHLMDMEAKGELDGFDPNNMSGDASKKATAAIKKMNDHATKESNRNNPIWSRRNKAKTEANRRKRAKDSHDAVEATASNKPGAFGSVAKTHDSVDSAHKRSSSFQASGEFAQKQLKQSVIADHGGQRFMVSTDGHRIAMIPVSDKMEEGKAYAHEVVGAKEYVRPKWGPGGHAGSMPKKGKKTGKVVEADHGAFPDWKRAMPKEDAKHTHTFDAEAFMAHAHHSTTSAHASKKTGNPHFHIFTEGGEVHVQAAHTAEYEDHKDAIHAGMHGTKHTAAEKHKGKGKLAVLNGKYVKQALEGAKGPIKVQYTGPRDPVIITRGDGEKHVIMPMNVGKDGLPANHPHNAATGKERDSAKKSFSFSSTLKKHREVQTASSTFATIVRDQFFKNMEKVKAHMKQGKSVEAAVRAAYPKWSDEQVQRMCTKLKSGMSSY